LSSFAAVIFDMDGVIVDSEPLQLESFNQILRPYGVQLSEDDFMRFVGSTQVEILTAIKSEFGIAKDTHELIQSKKDAYLTLAESRMEPMPGLYELIDWLEGLDFAIGLASSSPMEDIQAILGYLDLTDHFKSVVSSMDLAHGKPHPEVFLRAAQKLGVDPSRCVVLEDSGRGVEAAKRASMVCIAMPNRFTKHQDTSAADFNVGNLFEAKAVLEGLQQSSNPAD
jgi:beta-phosphoglucomutase family hydrolase